MHRDFFTDSDIFDSCTPFEYLDECDDSGFNPFENDGLPGEERGIDDLLQQGYASIDRRFHCSCYTCWNAATHWTVEDDLSLTWCDTCWSAAGYRPESPHPFEVTRDEWIALQCLRNVMEE
jgi:hypothetical protein